MRRSHVCLVDLEPVLGSGAGARRPAVVVSNDRANASATRRGRGRGHVTVVPVTSNTARILPFHVLLPAENSGLRVDSKAHAEQVRAVELERCGPTVGRLDAGFLRLVDVALRLHLQP